jgi:hypothetical protein
MICELKEMKNNNNKIKGDNLVQAKAVVWDDDAHSEETHRVKKNREIPKSETHT